MRGLTVNIARRNEEHVRAQLDLERQVAEVHERRLAAAAARDQQYAALQQLATTVRHTHDENTEATMRVLGTASAVLRSTTGPITAVPAMSRGIPEPSLNAAA